MLQARVQLLTCSPGEELYAKYGHTAIRVVGEEPGWDYCFNYGLFDFNTEGFYLKFIKGETYYLLGAEPTQFFEAQYAAEGRKIYRQTLDLTPEQEEAIVTALIENYQPENRQYLYNFVFDNCATRPYRLIRKVLGDSLKSDYKGWKGQTYREFIRHYTGRWSWADFGINLLFGPKADEKMTDEERLFLPEELMNWMEETGRVKESNTEAFEIAPVRWWQSWSFGMAIAAVLVALLSLYGPKKAVRAMDIAMGIGIVTVIVTVAYLTWWSLHPLVGFGWRLLIVPGVYIGARILGQVTSDKLQGTMDKQ